MPAIRDAIRVRILCFSRGYQKDKFSGCWWIRLKIPFQQLGRKHVVCLTDGKTEYPIDAYQIIVLNNVITDVDEMRKDSVVKRVSVEEMVQNFKRMGKKIVYDLDDAQDVHPLLGAVGKLVDDNLHSYFYLLKEADLITCTTEQLKKHLKQYTDKPIEVLPNCINPVDFPQRKKLDKIKIAYIGSYSHIPDFGICKDAITNLKRKHDIYFEIFGFKYHPFKSRNPVPMEFYYETMADVGADIGICPLLDNKFNHNKSPLKMLEYIASGTMGLASNRLPYKGEIPDKWLVNDEDWEKTLEKYILDKDLREKTLIEQRKWVFENRNIKLNWPLWEKAYRKVINGN